MMSRKPGTDLGLRYIICRTADLQLVEVGIEAARQLILRSIRGGQAIGTLGEGHTLGRHVEHIVVLSTVVIGELEDEVSGGTQNEEDNGTVGVDI